jgi:lipopolysaccharide export system permease protein
VAFFLLSSLAITIIVWVIQGVNLLDIISEQGHSFKIYFLYSILNIPKIFSKLIIFAYFLSLFVVINRYQDNNEILVFWINGIKKISFINFIFKISLLFVILQLTFNLLIVPYTQNLAQKYLKNSSIDFFPKLIQEKKFSKVMENLNIFVEKYNDDGVLEGIYIKESLKNNGNKIIIASMGKLNQTGNGYSFQLYNGKIINIDKKGSFNLGCGDKDTFLISDIYEETFKRIVSPIYIIILSLICSLLILNSKDSASRSLFKFFLFLFGFSIIIFSELSYKFVNTIFEIELIFLTLPIIFVILFYFFILLKTNFKLRYL